VPLDIISKLISGISVGKIQRLLKEQSAQHGIKFLGWPAHTLTKDGFKLGNRQFLQQMCLKQPGPVLVQLLPPLGTQESPRVEKFHLFVILDVDHAPPL